MARVELHAAQGDDYERLHTAMAALGFYRTARATDGVLHKLPTGMYWVESQYNTQTVLGFAQNVLRSVGKTGEITVTCSQETWFAGLPRA